ncbi:hypothetical protein UA08_02335 [Talaromyces atroroseus]|uniref:Uncharacterized protein n=1 Tax=Talaromyces atroroseus TaxID=1441469 RepID=A0A225B152_TALAT|nr:hypothetical protein UA08_02335 [Talaromyces atroroseus]OKL61709.1 hypothetical protein UA08_02335 [Talaromyces atroroseus]
MTLDFQSLPKEPPSAPRAMTYPTKDELEFSSSFNLLRAFGLFHGDDGDDGDNDIGRAEDSNFTEIELLQGYLIGVSYLCDIEKGGNTVTAAALSNDLELYLAANNDLHPKIQSFISRVVLEELRTDSVESRHKVAERILREAVQRAGKRMEFYFRKLKDIWGKCRVSVEDQFRAFSRLKFLREIKRVDFVQSSNRRALTLPESSLDFARLSKKSLHMGMR